ncbi:MAG: hypothetical protein O3B09_00680, partial [Proteobacteria bacterium]|nr:hypothetical protein [Pseudomonadota bacterium]
MAQLKLRKAHRQSKHELNPKASTFFPDIDFIPFVSHYSNNSILTKNGELLQVIKITGFNHESIDSELVNLREAIRDSITNNIQSNNFALWLHTVRRKSNIAPHGEFPDFFSQKLNEIWEEENNWKKQFVNELYLTIIIEGYDTSISNINSLLRSLSTKGTRNLHLQKLEKANERLTETTQKILEDLNSYGAQLLGIEEKKG